LQTRGDVEPAQERQPDAWALHALSALRGQWNVHMAGVDSGARGVPIQPGLDVLVLADVTPGMSARELVARGRDALGLQTDVPIVVLTTSAAADRRTALLEAGADDCLSMPVAAGELSARVARLVRVARQMRELQELTHRLSAGFRRPPQPPGDAEQALRREGDYWTINHAGVTLRVRDCKGLRHLARLLAYPHIEVHALLLTAAPFEGGGGGDVALVAQAGDRWRRGLGDAGPMLDAEAKAAYRRRLEDLNTMLDEARAFADRGRCGRIEAEMHALTRELAAAIGLGGRDRRGADAAERARINVTRTIKGAIAAIARHHRPLGQHLRATVRTGTFSSYEPPPGTGGAWLVG
jgi:DNA-binding response OmpR family regulator